MSDEKFLAQILQGCAAASRVPSMQYTYNAREVVYRLDKVTLYHYHGKQRASSRPPVLVVFATINRPEILDLIPEKSFVRGLLEAGSDVYLLDWGYPDQQDQHINMHDYVARYLDACIDFIKQKNKQSKIDVVGICQGGLLCLCHALLFNKIRKLVLLSAPIDFHTEHDRVSHIMRQINWREQTVLKKNVPGLWLTQFFIALKPFELINKKYLNFIDTLEQDSRVEQFLLVEKWLYDAPDQPGVAFGEFMQELYQGNKLVRGEFKLGDKKLDLAQLNIPILNITAIGDHIVPPAASQVLRQFVDKKYYAEHSFPSGHIGLYVSDKAGKKAGEYIAGWL